LDTSLFVRKADGIVDQWRAHDVPLGGLMQRERNTMLRRAFVRWQHGHSPLATICKMHPPLPPGPIDRANFDPGILSYFTIDTAPDDPLEFQVVLPGAGGRRIRIGDIRTTILRRVLPIEINNVKCTRCAAYQRIEQRIDGVLREYYRLMLPIPGDDFRIARIGCFARPLLEDAASPAMSDDHV
jgi:hypothetical protein